MRALLFALAAAIAPISTSALHFNYTMWSSKLRADLLADYDKGSPATSVRAVSYSSAGTDVSLQIRFYKVINVHIGEGTMALKVWWRTSWTDLRLSWDPAQYGGITEVRFNAASFSLPEDSEIWLPDITVYNALDGLMKSFDAAPALVHSDGTVTWSRPGTLSVLCRFSGLLMYPFDELSCPMEVGGWITGGALQGLRAAGGGCATFSAEEETSLASYQEMNIERVECHEDLLEYACCPNDPYPILRYRITLKRSGTFHVMSTVIPLIVFTVLSFFALFMPYDSGERLGFGVTLVLTIEFTRQASISILPISGELLWIELAYYVNFLFSILSLLESCVVLALAYNDSKHFMPRGLAAALGNAGEWILRVLSCGTIRWAGGKVQDRAGRVRRRLNVKQRRGGGNGLAADGGGAVSAAERTMKARFRQESGKDPGVTPPPSPPQRQGEEEEGEENPSSLPPLQHRRPLSNPPTGLEGGGEGEGENGSRRSVLGRQDTARDDLFREMMETLANEGALANGGGGGGTTPSADQVDSQSASKLLFFESLFHQLDVDGGGTISFEEMRRMLAFAGLDMSTEERERHLREADSIERDGVLDRFEFLDLCVDMLWDQTLDQLQAAANTYSEFREALKRRAMTYWRRCALTVDRHCRFWIPLLYVVSMGFMFGLAMDDDYKGRSRNAASGTGATPAELSGSTYEYTKLFDQVNASYANMNSGLNGVIMRFDQGSVTLFVVAAVVALLVVLGQAAAGRLSEMKQLQSAYEQKTVAEYTKNRMKRNASSVQQVAPDPGSRSRVYVDGGAEVEGAPGASPA